MGQQTTTEKWLLYLNRMDKLVMRFPVATEWHVLRLRMEETASGCGR